MPENKVLEPLRVTLELRGHKYQGILTDSDGLLFLSALMNSYEISLLDQGRLAEAGVALQSRFDKRRQELAADGKGDEEVTAEISTTMLHRVERDPAERSRVAARIKERFPTIPNDLVRWDSPSSFAIALHLEEVMQLLVAVIGPALQQFDTFKAKEDPVAAETAGASSENKMAAAAAEIIELEDRIEVIKEEATQEPPLPPERILGVADIEKMQEDRAAIVQMLKGNLNDNLRTALVEQVKEIDVQIGKASQSMVARRG